MDLPCSCFSFLVLIFLLSTWFSLLFDQQRCLFWLQCLGNIHLNSKCVFFRSFREWYVCLIHWQGAGLLKSVSALCPCCLGPSSTVWLRVADTFMALCDIFFPLLISSPFPVPRPLAPCSRDSLAMSLKVLLAVESAVPEAGEGKWRCLSTQTLLPAFPTSSFPKQTGGFLQVSHGQNTSGFAVCSLQGEEQASHKALGEGRSCVWVGQASKYSGEDI